MLLNRYFAGILVFILACNIAQSLFAESNSSNNVLKSIEKLINTQSGDVGISIIDLNSKQKYFSYNAEKNLKPASVLKILTSIAAFENLGPNFVFKTKIYSQGQKAGSVKNIYIKGGGDPNLTLEEVWLMARAIKLRGIERVESLVLDDTVFASIKSRQGQRAFETGSSGLAFNFNSVAIEICPSQGTNALVHVDPWESDIKINGQIKMTSRGTDNFSIDELDGEQNAYLLSGQLRTDSNCIRKYRSINDPVGYFGQVFKNLLQNLGIKVDAIQRRETAKSANLIYTHSSKELALIIKDLNHFSTNFIAEQLLFALGQVSDDRLDRELGLKRLTKFIKLIEPLAQGFNLDDASGLSHENRISAQVLSGLLGHAYAQNTYAAEFITSLSTAGDSGTLKDRDFVLNGAEMRGKTGNINGVSSLAGYLFNKSGRKFAFTILQNGVSSREKAFHFQEQLTKLLSTL